MRILIDADGVLENLPLELTAFLNEKYGSNIRFSEMREWGYANVFPELSQEQIISAELEETFYDRIRPNDGAQEYLKKLMDDGHTVYIVTHTPYEAVYWKMKKVMERYFPFLTWENFILTSKKQMIKGDILIDDGIHNLLDGDYRKILFSAPYNEDYDAEKNGMIRVSSWAEIYRVITQLNE